MTADERGSFDPIPCPMTGCDEALYMTLGCSIPLLDVHTAEDLGDPRSACSQTWQVECVAGHVVVLPKDTGQDYHNFGDREDPDNDDIARLREATGWTP